MKRLSVPLLAGAAACALAVQFPAEAGAQTEKVIYSFSGSPDGASPYFAGMIDVKGTLYGTTQSGGSYGGGTVFSVNPQTGVENVLHSFGSGTDGIAPYASLIDVKGKLYGTTEYGGGFGSGTVFSVNPKTGAEELVYSFCRQGGTDCTDGAYPHASLIDVNGTLYGTTFAGGPKKIGKICTGGEFPGCGTVFSINLKSGQRTVVYAFCSQQSCTDGDEPSAGLIEIDDMLYGTTLAGGSSQNCEIEGPPGCGTVFSLDPATGAETVLHSFCSQGGTDCTDGDFPYAGLTDVKGMLYGTTKLGGVGAAGGTVFSVDPQTGAEKVLHTFAGGSDDGEYPETNLIYEKGKLYGTTVVGGDTTNCNNFGCGTVFELSPRTGAETVLYYFAGGSSDGEYPYSGLIDVKGTLYGTTGFGDMHDDGTVFAVKP